MSRCTDFFGANGMVAASPKQMNPRKTYVAISGGFFALSFFLPSFETSPSNSLSGYACFRVCLSVLVRSGDGKNTSMGAWLYYSGFVAANLLFVILLVAACCSRTCSRLRGWMSAIILLQVISWLVVNLVALGNGDHFSLKIGYFVWLLAFISLLCAQICVRDMQNPSADVTPP